MSEVYDQREALHAAGKAAAQWPDLRTAWVIYDDENDGFDNVKETLLRRSPEQGEDVWVEQKRQWVYHHGLDVFATELAARNELEQRLYARAENLRKHREEMSRALVRCADGGGVL